VRPTTRFVHRENSQDNEGISLFHPSECTVAKNVVTLHLAAPISADYVFYQITVMIGG
jgi:hypothetical protein